MQRNGVVLVVCAPSGAGKTTLIKRLTTEFPDLGFSVSCTTRPPRAGEQDGVDYHFLSREDFIARRKEGYFAEWAEVHGNFYGTPLAPTLQKLQEGRDLLFDIDVQGAAQLRLTIPDGLYAFILPPSLRVLEERLRKRGTDDEEVIARRLANAVREIQEAHWFNAWIVNDDLERAYDEFRAAYVAYTLEPKRRPLLLRRILDSKAGGER